VTTPIFQIWTKEELLNKAKLPEPFLVRKGLKEEFIQELKESIEETGVKVPLILSDDYYVIDGVHRYLAIKQIEKSLNIPVAILRGLKWEENPYKCILLAYKINRERIGASDQQFNEKLLKEAFHKVILKIASETPEQTLTHWVNEIKQGKYPYHFVMKLVQVTELNKHTVYRYLDALILEFGVDEFCRQLLATKKPGKIEVWVEKPYGAPVEGVHLSEPHTVERSVPISRAEEIKKISEYADISPEKLMQLTKQELKKIAKMVEEGERPKKIRQVVEEIIREKVERKVEEIKAESRREFLAFNDFWKAIDKFVNAGISRDVLHMTVAEVVYYMFFRLLDFGYEPREVYELMKKTVEAFKSCSLDQVKTVLAELEKAVSKVCKS